MQKKTKILNLSSTELIFINQLEAKKIEQI